MCTVLVDFDPDGSMPLSVLHNRDEFFERASQAASWREEGYLAGTDLPTGGTWFGVKRSGHFALLTNAWSDKSSQRVGTRGDIVHEILVTPPLSEIESFLQARTKYSEPFSVIFGDPSQIYYFGVETNKITELPPGIHTLSSGALNAPRFKTDVLRHRYDSLPKKPRNSELLQLLTDRSIPPTVDVHLREVFPEEIGLKLGCIFVETPTYGTRCSSVFTISREGKAQFTEKTHPVGPQVVESYAIFDYEVVHGH